jgi:1-acyl-sn-glycerol-3-phosphate acyltransferase
MATLAEILFWQVRFLLGKELFWNPAVLIIAQSCSAMEAVLVMIALELKE